MTRKVSDTRASAGGAARGPTRESGGARPARSPGRGTRAAAGSGASWLLRMARPYAVSVAALAGLLLVTVVTLQLFGATLPIIGAGTGELPDDPDAPILTPDKTPSPSAPPVLNKEISIAGRLAYVKAGNIWVQEGTETRRITTTGRDSQPAWAPDGELLYFIETKTTKGMYPDPDNGKLRSFTLSYPVLTRVRRDGSDRESILSGLYRPTATTRYFYFLKSPAVAPDGKKVAVTSDGPKATERNVVVQLIDLGKKRLTNLGLPEYRVLGHQDPAWSPDGKFLAYVRNGADGPQIWRYTVETEKARVFTDNGYTQPVYSPNGRYIAATRTNSIGNNIVVLDGRTGAELLRVTKDDRSWGPAWSPDGKQLVYLRLAKSGYSNDLFVSSLTFDAAGVPSLDDTEKALTRSSGLDGESRPAWWGKPAAGGVTEVLVTPDPSATGNPPTTAPPSP